MMSEKLKLTVKTSAMDLRTGEISLFPTEGTDAPAFSQKELFNLSELYSPLYQSYVDSISAHLTTHYNIEKSVSSIFAREAIVPLIHCFMDRLIRLDRLLKSCEKKQVVIVAPGHIDVPMNIEEFKLLSGTSYHFNQSILCRLSELYDLLVEDDVEAHQIQNVSCPGYKYINYNYRQKKYIKARRLLFKVCSKMISYVKPSCEGKIPVLGMSYATPYLQARGFYGMSSFVYVGQRFKFDPSDPNYELRSKILRPALSEAYDEHKSFINSVNLNDKVSCDKIIDTFQKYVLEYYPSILLEDITLYLDKCTAELNKYVSRSIICSNAGAVESTYYLAAAQSLGMDIIEFQEGGHEGYEDDYVQSLDAEYNYINKFISWGWTHLPYERLDNDVSVVPLPSPWLEERRKVWEKHFLKRNSKKSEAKYDFLFMPNKIWPYPPAPSGANISRIDHINEFSAILKEFVKKATSQELTILHKAFNESTVDILHYTMGELEELGGERYHCDSDLSKGLRPELVDSCKLILWDQPGTGFLECLTSSIPTMILWPRIFNKEVPKARNIFLELEDVGICHTNVDSLIDEYKIFKKSSQKWMNNLERIDAVNRFCREYAWVEVGWPAYWRKFIDSQN